MRYLTLAANLKHAIERVERPGGAIKAKNGAVVSWNQVGRTDLTPVKLPESVLLTLPRRKLTTYWTFHATWRS